MCFRFPKFDSIFNLYRYSSAGGQPVSMSNIKAVSELARSQPRAGRLVLHAHGRRCLMHEGEEVVTVSQRDLFGKYGWPAKAEINEAMLALKEKLEQ